MISQKGSETDYKVDSGFLFCFSGAITCNHCLSLHDSARFILKVFFQCFI